MDQTMKSAVPSVRIALVAGACIFLAHAVSFKPRFVTLGPTPSLFAAACAFCAFFVLAYGIPRALTGQPAEGGLARTRPFAGRALAASGALWLVAAVAQVFFPTDFASAFSPGGRAFAVVLQSLDYAAVLALVAAAIATAGSHALWRGARLGLVILAALAVLDRVLPLPLLVIAPDRLQEFATALSWQSTLFEVVACGIGVALAWPWLAPRVRRGLHAVGRARDRWVDSTP